MVKEEWEGDWDHPYHGVSFKKTAHKTRAWRAELKHQGQHHRRGGFGTAKAAALAWDELAREVAGRTDVNFPTPEESAAQVTARCGIKTMRPNAANDDLAQPALKRSRATAGVRR